LLIFSGRRFILGETKGIEKLSYYATSIGLIYLIIGLLSGFCLVYILVRKGAIPGTLISAHSHFLCMSMLILIVGLGMKNWAREIAEKKISFSGGRLTAARISLALLALGAIMAFVFFSVKAQLLGLIGDIIYFIGFLMVSIGWITGGKT